MREPLILTVTGRRINPLNVRPEDVCEEDVAHHLACINRFNGALRQPISVAQHAVFVSRLLEGTGYEWLGMHHDDGEAYVGDMTKWLKEADGMETFRDAEDRAQRACYVHFGVPPSQYEGYHNLMPPIVEAADRLMVRFEGDIGYEKGIWDAWREEVVGAHRYPPITPEDLERIGRFKPWSWRAAKEAWLTRLRILREIRASEVGSGRSPDASGVA